MTISGVQGARGGTFAHADPAEMITTTGGSLASLMLDTQTIERNAERERLESARGEFKQALAEEVSELHEAADQVFWGAVVQGSLGAVAGAASIYGAVRSNAAVTQALVRHNDQLLSVALKPTSSGVFGEALGTIASPAGKFVSGSDGEHSRADAKAASGKGEQAKWQMDDVKERLDQAEQTSDRTTQWVSTIVDKQDATMSSLIQDFA